MQPQSIEPHALVTELRAAFKSAKASHFRRDGKLTIDELLLLLTIRRVIAAPVRTYRPGRPILRLPPRTPVKDPTRRTAIAAGCAAVATLLVKTEAVVADPRLEDIQALVSDLRNCDRSLMMAVWVAFQEVTDRLETLPGIVPVPNEWWRTWRAEHHDKPTNLKWPIGPYLARRA